MTSVGHFEECREKSADGNDLIFLGLNRSHLSNGETICILLIFFVDKAGNFSNDPRATNVCSLVVLRGVSATSLLGWKCESIESRTHIYFPFQLTPGPGGRMQPTPSVNNEAEGAPHLNKSAGNERLERSCPYVPPAKRKMKQI